MENNSPNGQKARTPTNQRQAQGQRPVQRQANSQRPDQGQRQGNSQRVGQPQGNNKRPSQSQATSQRTVQMQCQRPNNQQRQYENPLESGFSLGNNGGAVEPPVQKKKIPILALVIGVIALIVVGGLLVARAKFSKDIDNQRVAVLKEQTNLNEMIVEYSNNVMPLLLECVAYTKSKTTDYDSTLKALDTFSKSGKTYNDYKSLKLSVDSFINYTKTIEGLTETAGYKEKINNLNFYSVNIGDSLNSYNQLVNSYNIFKNNFKYKFIGKNNEFSLIEE